MTYRTYISKTRHNAYQFRIIIPSELRGHFNDQREIRRSLRTDSRYAAIIRARFMWVEFQKVFTLMSKTKKKSKYVLSTELFTHIDAFGDESTYDLKDDDKELELIEKLNRRKEEILLNNQIAQFVRNNKTTNQKPEFKSYSIKELIPNFFKDHESLWEPKTCDDYSNAFDVLAEITGDVDITKLDKEFARKFKEGLQSYPVNRKKGRLKSMSLKEIQDETDYKIISSNTIQKNYTRITTFINWCYNNGYCKGNPLTGMSPKTNKANKARRAFQPNELDLIFTQEIFTQHKYKQNWHFWLPILAYATGARIEEICQLKGVDIKKQDQIYYFDIKEGEDTKLKNAASNRRIPVHKDLIRLGLLNLASERSEKRLFDLDHYKSEKLSHQPSKWFGNLKTKLGFPSTVTYHSFRHLMRDMLSEAETPSEKIKAILGHEQGDTTFGVYGSKFKPEHLDKHIQTLDLFALRHINPL